MPGVKIDARMENGTMVYQVKAEWSPEDLEARDKAGKRKCFGKKDAPTDAPEVPTTSK
jgi:hypothetical protein